MTGAAGAGTQTTAQERGRKFALAVLFLAAWGVGRFALGMGWFSAILFSVALAFLGDALLAYWRYRRKVVGILAAAPSSEEVFRLLKDPNPDSALLDTYAPPVTFAFLTAEICGVDALFRHFEAPVSLTSLGIYGLTAAVPAGLVAGLVYLAMAMIVPRWFDTLALARSSEREVCREAVARWEAWLAHLDKVLKDVRELYARHHLDREVRARVDVIELLERHRGIHRGIVSPKAMMLLEGLLQNTSVEVWLVAARVLGDLGGESVIEALRTSDPRYPQLYEYGDDDPDGSKSRSNSENIAGARNAVGHARSEALQKIAQRAATKV